MQTFWAAARAMLWGTALFVLLIVAGVSITVALTKCAQFRDNSFTQKAAAARAAIATDIDRLDKIAGSREYRNGVFAISAPSRLEADVLENKIGAKAREICGYSCVDI